MTLREIAEKYFSGINSMASRICVDMKQTELSYEHLWQTLSFEEQQQVLNQSIIKPEVTLKYPFKEEPLPEIKQYAVKVIVDDNYSYRDEHSAPFSFRTTSQRDLSICHKKTSPKSSAIKIIPPKLIVPVIPRKQEVIPPCQNIGNHVEEDDDDADSLTHILPKTGLDLLDNW